MHKKKKQKKQKQKTKKQKTKKQKTKKQKTKNKKQNNKQKNKKPKKTENSFRQFENKNAKGFFEMTWYRLIGISESKKRKKKPAETGPIFELARF